MSGEPEEEDADARAATAADAGRPFAGPSPGPDAGAAPAGAAPAHLSISPRIVASLLDLTERRLQQLVAQGWIPRPERGQYNLRESIRGYVKFLRHQSRDNTRGTETARLARAQAVKVEMENFRRMGELAVWGQIDDLLRGLVNEVRSAHEGFPGRLSSELAAITEPQQVYLRLQTELRRVDDFLADYLEKRAGDFASVPEPGTADEAERPDDAGDMGADESGDAG